MTAEELYRREAERLRAMADAFQYAIARDGFLIVADQFEALAEREQGLDAAD